MQAVQDETLSGALVVLDGKFFVNCKYTDCTLIFCGGDYGWVNSQFVNCRLNFDGPATRTLNLCKIFGIIKGEPTDHLAQPPTDTKVN